MGYPYPKFCLCAFLGPYSTVIQRQTTFLETTDTLYQWFTVHIGIEEESLAVGVNLYCSVQHHSSFVVGGKMFNASVSFVSSARVLC